MLRVGAFVLACVVASCAWAAEMVDNPAYQSWSKYKPGTEVAIASETAVAGMNMKMDMTQKLTEVTPEKAVVEITVQSPMMPTPQKQSVTHPAKIEAEKAQSSGKMPEGMKGEVKQLGKEKVSVDGKEYECEVAQFTGETQGMKMNGKTWTSNQIPGQVAKMEMNGEGEQKVQTKMAVTKFTQK